MTRYKYLKVHWKHRFPDEPIILYSEIDEEGWEIRKVEQFANGTLLFASEDLRSNSTLLSEKPIPSLEEINSLKEFEGQEIDLLEFEAIWAQNNTR